MSPCSLKFHDETNEAEWLQQMMNYNKYFMVVLFFFKIFDTISKLYTEAHERNSITVHFIAIILHVVDAVLIGLVFLWRRGQASSDCEKLQTGKPEE